MKQLIILLLLMCPTTGFVEDYLYSRCGQECVDIAFCESSFRYNAKNPNSSATGLFSFTFGTFNWIGGGDIYDIELQTDYFIKYYPKYPGWWKECLWSNN